MSNTASTVLKYPSRLWARINAFLCQANERQVAAWGSSLQYKRNYTNPEAAKLARRPV